VPQLLVRRDLLDLRRERVFGCFEIEVGLNVHPERSAGLEEFAELQRGAGRNGAVPTTLLKPIAVATPRSRRGQSEACPP